MSTKELTTVISSLTEYQVQAVIKQIKQYLALNEELQDTYPKACPCCGAVDGKFIKKGFQHGKQRYQCKCCESKFTYDVGRITSGSHMGLDAWAIVIEDTLSLQPLRVTEEKLSISHPTAWNMRHKLLVYMEDIIDPFVSLEPLVEADETYVLENQKGTPVTQRKARYRGGRATKRGLSNEQYCVCVATDRVGHTVMSCVNRAQPTSDNVIDAIGKHIASDSIIMCDGSHSYNKLVSDTHSTKKALVGHESYNRLYHLNTVNSIHSRFSSMLRQFRGIATKYLNRYLALFTLLLSNTEGFGDFLCDVRQRLNSVSKSINIKSLDTVGILAF